MNTKNTNLNLLHNDASVAATVQSLRNQILDGEVDALAAYINLGRMEKIISEVKKDSAVIDCALNEFAKYGQKTVTMGDCEVTEGQVGVRYDFSECNDAELDDLYRLKTSTDIAIKERENFLRGLKHTITVANEETGEICAIHPPVKTSKTTLKLTYKK